MKLNSIASKTLFLSTLATAEMNHGCVADFVNHSAVTITRENFRDAVNNCIDAHEEDFAKSPEKRIEQVCFDERSKIENWNAKHPDQIQEPSEDCKPFTLRCTADTPKPSGPAVAFIPCALLYPHIIYDEEKKPVGYEDKVTSDFVAMVLQNRTCTYTPVPDLNEDDHSDGKRNVNLNSFPYIEGDPNDRGHSY